MTPNHRSSLFQGKGKTALILISLLFIIGCFLSACGGNTATTSNKKHILTIGDHVGSDFTKLLSPYNLTAVNEGIQGMVYEPLYFFNVNNGAETPWLATGYSWSSDYLHLTFTIRQNVKWSDGKSFTANDVAFTFNMLKQYPAADINGLWTNYLSSVTAPDTNTVVVTFQKPYPPAIWYIAGQTYIVPQHIFANVNPTTFANDNPIGTGPFTLTKFSPELLVYSKNPNYWQADKVKVDQLDYPAVKDNTTLQLELAKGQIDWGSFFAPDLNTTFVALDPAHNHYWMAPTNLFALYLNLSKAPFNDVNVRQAISAALNRSQMANQAESGYVAPASTTGLILPNENSYLDPSYATVQENADTQKAIQLLQTDGYTKGSDGIYQKNGVRLAFHLDVVSGWTDWEAMARVIIQNLKSVGMAVTLNDIQDTAYYNARDNGSYDALIGGMFAGPTPFYLYNTHLNSANLSPKGYDWSKWQDPTTNRLLQEYASTTNVTVQKQAIQGLEKIFVTELPTIPLVNAASWYEYSTKNFTGWPDQNNPYAVGSAYQVPDDEVVVTHLIPAN